MDVPAVAQFISPPGCGGKAPSLPGNRDIKAPRWNISRPVLVVLEQVFALEKFPSQLMRQRLSADLGVTPRQVQVWFQNRRQRERTMRRAESEKRNGGPDDSSIESLSSSTATEYPEAQESGWGDKELSAFLSTPDQVMQALSDSGAGPSQQAAVPSLTTQYFQTFENVFRQSRRAVVASTAPSTAHSAASTHSATQPQAAPLGVAGLNPAYWQGLPASPVPVGHSWPQQPQEQRANNHWVAASSNPYYQRQQQDAAAALAHQAAQYQAQLQAQAQQQEQQTAQYVAQHAANMLGSNSAMHPDSEAFAQLAAALGLGSNPQAQLEVLMRMQGGQHLFQGQMPVPNIQGVQSVPGVQHVQGVQQHVQAIPPNIQAVPLGVPAVQQSVQHGVQGVGSHPPAFGCVPVVETHFGNQQQLPGGALLPSPAVEEMDAEPSSVEPTDSQPTLVAAPAPAPAPLVVEAMPHTATLAQQCAIAAKQLSPQLPPTQLLYRVLGGNGSTHLINEVTDEDLHDLIVDELPELSRGLAPSAGGTSRAVPQPDASSQSA